MTPTVNPDIVATLEMEWDQLSALVTDYVNDKLEAAGRGHLTVGTLDNPVEGKLTIGLIQRQQPTTGAMTLDQFLGDTFGPPGSPSRKAIDAEYAQAQAAARAEADAARQEAARLQAIAEANAALAERARKAQGLRDLGFSEEAINAALGADDAANGRIPRLPRVTMPEAPVGVASRKVYTSVDVEEDEEPPPLVDPADGLAARLGAELGLERPTVKDGLVLYGAPPPVSDEDRAAFALLQAKGLVAPHLTPELLASSTRDDIRDGVGESLPGNGYVVGSTPPAGHPDDPHKNKPWRRKQGTVAEILAESGRLRQQVS